MSTNSAIREAIESAQFIVQCYLQDLTDGDLLQRPSPGCNHINWQLGHLISSEHWMIDKASPGCMPELPDGFTDRYTKLTAASDDPSQFLPKSELMEAARLQRAATLSTLTAMSEADFRRPSGVPYAPTVSALFLMQCTHWLMHAGQWAIIRRQLGRPPLF